MAAKIKRELQVKFSTTGDGQVVRSIASVDTALKSTEAAGQGAGKSIADLSESLDKGLENSVGRAFKATDRLNSIVGQVTGAIGLATLAVTGAVAIYNKFSKSANAVGAGHDFLSVALKNTSDALERGRQAADEMRKAEERLAAAIGVRLALIDPAVRKQFLQNEQTIKAAEISVEAIRNTVAAQQAQRAALLKTIEAQEKALQQAAKASNVVASDVQAKADAVVASRAQLVELEKSIKANDLLVGSQQAAIRTADAWTKGLVEQGKAVEGLSAATAGKGTAQAPSLKSSLDAAVSAFAPVQSAMAALTAAARGLAQAVGVELQAAYQSSLPGLADALGAVNVDNLAAIVGAGPSDQADLLKIPETFEQTSAAMDAAQASAESFGNSAAQALGGAAAAALVYGDSFSDVAAQAVASLATQAASQAVFQGAMALAYLARGLFTGLPSDFEAASTAAASAATFGAVAAVSVPIARATGSASGAGAGGGVPAGPSARDAGLGGPGADSGGGDTIILNVGTPISTEADIGAAVATALNASGRSRGRTRVNRRAIGRA